MSKYPMAYRSESKHQDIEIESMASPYIANALRKMMAADECDMALADCLTQELVTRGCRLGEDGKWVFPAKEVAS